jgi:hypothetical protein
MLIKEEKVSALGLLKIILSSSRNDTVRRFVERE